MTILLTALLLAAYDPLAVPAFEPKPIDETWKDANRSREVPVRLFLPESKGPAPTVLFSHGLGGTRNMNAFLGEHLAKRGYVAIFVQHPGSDDSVWRGAPMRDRMSRMNAAASGQNLVLRVDDVKFVLDEATRRSSETGNALSGRVDPRAFGMSGHSFGAVTTQATSGQRYPGIGTTWTDPRIRAAVAYSPSVPKAGNPSLAFGDVRTPWLLLTGTKDGSPIGNTTPEDRMKVFPALPAGGKYECVLWEAEHSAFTERALPGESNKRNPNHHRAMLALTTAFWDAYLKQDSQAKAWLKGDGPKTILEAKDTWKTK